MRTSSIGEHEFDLPVKDVPSSKARSMVGIVYAVPMVVLDREGSMLLAG